MTGIESGCLELVRIPGTDQFGRNADVGPQSTCILGDESPFAIYAAQDMWYFDAFGCKGRIPIFVILQSREDENVGEEFDGKGLYRRQASSGGSHRSSVRNRRGREKDAAALSWEVGL